MLLLSIQLCGQTDSRINNLISEHDSCFNHGNYLEAIRIAESADSILKTLKLDNADDLWFEIKQKTARDYYYIDHIERSLDIVYQLKNDCEEKGDTISTRYINVIDGICMIYSGQKDNGKILEWYFKLFGYIAKLENITINNPSDTLDWNNCYQLAKKIVDNAGEWKQLTLTDNMTFQNFAQDLKDNRKLPKL